MTNKHWPTWASPALYAHCSSNTEAVKPHHCSFTASKPEEFAPSLTCSSGWLMASTHLVCTWTSYNHSADEPLNTRIQGSKCSHLQRHYLFSLQDSSNQIILLVSIQQVIFSNVVFGCTPEQIEREKVWKDFLKIKTTATYSSFLPFPSPPGAHFWSYTSF